MSFQVEEGLVKLPALSHAYLEACWWEMELESSVSWEVPHPFNSIPYIALWLQYLDTAVSSISEYLVQ